VLCQLSFQPVNLGLLLFPDISEFLRKFQIQSRFKIHTQLNR
jgi:hypothetical protein